MLTALASGRQGEPLLLVRHRDGAG